MIHQDLHTNQLIRTEISELRNAGFDEDIIRTIEEKSKEYNDKDDYAGFLLDLDKVDWSYLRQREPSKFEAIVDQFPQSGKITFPENAGVDLYDRIYGAWLARCAGCTLGKPVEGWHHEKIKKYLTAANSYPLTTYIPAMTEFPDGLALHKNYLGTTLGRIKNMVRDDDIDYTVLGLVTLEKFGREFTTSQIGEMWLRTMPFWSVYTAEAVAYRNLVNEIDPPLTADFGNPYREFLGALIRADMWGYVNPGNPLIASEFAFRDASLSHMGNGIYAEMWAAACIAAAFSISDPLKVIETGLGFIPRNSRLAQAIRQTIDWCERYSNWEKVLKEIIHQYECYSEIHTINNTCLIVMGLLFGGGDLERTLCITLMGGYDTDSNCATAGSIVGMMVGAESLPEKWILPLNDKLESMVMGFGNCAISNLAERTIQFVVSR
jgi:hypothetical protein